MMGIIVGEANIIAGGSINDCVRNGNRYVRHDDDRGRSINDHVRCGNERLVTEVTYVESRNDLVGIINN